MANSRGKSVENIIIKHDLVVVNDGLPTHFSTHHSFTHVDIAMCSSSLAPKVVCRTLDNLHGSDHFPIITSFANKASIKCTPKPKFITDRADWKLFQSLSSSLSATIPTSHNINKETAIITKILRQAAHKSIPQTHFRPRNKAAPWWNHDLTNLRNSKQHLWYVFKRDRSKENLIAYKKANALFKRSAKTAKRDCFTKFTESISSTSSARKIWLDIKLITGSVKGHNHILHINTPNGVLSNSVEMANYFAATWSKYSSDVNFPTEFIEHKNRILDGFYCPSTLSTKACIIENDISITEYDTALRATKGKTPGADRICYPIIKNLPPPLKSRLINLYNSILEQGNYPQLWKNATIIPIPKPGKAGASIEGFRPISLLPCAGKLLEKIIAKRIMWFVISNNFICPNQVAFESKHGTLDALLHFDHFVSDVITKKHHVSTLRIDFEKAFDRMLC